MMVSGREWDTPGLSPEPPRVSVLVTLFNRAEHLEPCVRSVLSSTYRDFELVIVDDASTDHSLGVAQRLASTDQRIVVFRNSHNLGDYGNRNQAAGHARGDYLKYVDADDILYPDSLMLMMRAMEAAPEAGLGLSWNVIDPPKPFPFLSTSREALHAHFLGTSFFGVGPSAAILRRQAFQEVGGFSGNQFTGDSELWVRLADRYPVVSLPPSLVWWRRHDGQQTFLEERDVRMIVTRFELESALLMETPHLDEPEKNEAAERLRQRHARRLLALSRRSRDPMLGYRLLRESGMRLRDVLSGLKPYK